MSQHESNSAESNFSRRTFMAGAGAAAVGLSLASSRVAFGYAANEKVKIGLLGCGGRGGWIADLFVANGGYELAAVADYFAERTDNVGNKHNVPAERRYNGLGGYRRLIESGGVDALVIETPPYFHPEQAAAAVEAGKHVYCAKPIAVDVPGCRTIEESGKAATAKKLCFLVDFQTRADEFFIEALKRVHEGAIGKFAFGEATYHADVPFAGPDRGRRARRRRIPKAGCGLGRSTGALSGDIITEQNIHTLDVASWIMGSRPWRAFGTGGPQAPRLSATAGTRSASPSISGQRRHRLQLAAVRGHGTQPEGIRNRMFGTDGVLETEYGGQVLIRGKNFWAGGSSPGDLQGRARSPTSPPSTRHPEGRCGRTRPCPRACAATW